MRKLKDLFNYEWSITLCNLFFFIPPDLLVWNMDSKWQYKAQSNQHTSTSCFKINTQITLSKMNADPNKIQDFQDLVYIFKVTKNLIIDQTDGKLISRSSIIGRKTRNESTFFQPSFRLTSSQLTYLYRAI